MQTRSEPAARTPAPRAAPPFSLSARVDILQPVGTRTLKPLDKIYPGEQFTISAWADQPVYLYAVGYEPQGWSALLFPRNGHQQIKPGEPVLISAGGLPYEVKESSGEFSLQVYASLRPLDAQGCARLRLECPLWPTETGGAAGTDRSAGSLARNTERPPPVEGKKRPDRGGELVTQGDRHVLVAAADAAGNAVVTYTVQHAEAH